MVFIPETGTVILSSVPVDKWEDVVFIGQVGYLREANGDHRPVALRERGQSVTVIADEGEWTLGKYVLIRHELREEKGHDEEYVIE